MINDRLLYEYIIPENKLQKARLNIINYINQVWNNEEQINATIIKNSFKIEEYREIPNISLEEGKKEREIFYINPNYNKFKIIDNTKNESDISIDSLDLENSKNEEINENSIINEDNLDYYKKDIQELEENLILNDLNKIYLDEN